MADLSYARIRERRERRYAERLVKRLTLPWLAPEEVVEVTDALAALDDPRTWPRLTWVISGRRHLDGVRRAASDVLTESSAPLPEDATLRAWWSGDDKVLQRHALRLLRDSDPELLAGVAADSLHPLQADALWWMDTGFELPRYLDIKAAALSHPEPRVREAAAWVLLADEPLRAEPLLHAATADAVPYVAEQACASLCGFPSLATWDLLEHLQDHPDLGPAACGALDTLEERALAALAPLDLAAGARLRRWLGRHLDPLVQGEPAPAAPAVPAGHLPVDSLVNLIEDPDVSLAELEETLLELDWTVYSAGERRALAHLLVPHADPRVRALGAAGLAAWGDSAALLDLLQDPSPRVRDHAVAQLSRLPPQADLAPLAWDVLLRVRHLGPPARDALAALLVHAPSAEALARVQTLFQEDAWPDSLRAAAVRALASRGRRADVKPLLPCLAQPPRVGWELHVALLQAARTLDLALPELRALEHVDHLDVQSALAAVTR